MVIALFSFTTFDRHCRRHRREFHRLSFSTVISQKLT